MDGADIICHSGIFLKCCENGLNVYYVKNDFQYNETKGKCIWQMCRKIVT